MADLDPQALKDLNAAIAPTAPALAKLLDGPNAGLAVAALGKALLGDAQAAVADVVMAARSGDDATRLKIIEAQQDSARRLQDSRPALSLSDLGSSTASEEKMDTQDREDARQRQITLHDETNKWLAYIVTSAFFLIIVLLIFFGERITSDRAVSNILFALLGMVGTSWANIIGFYFGSSSGSQQKSQTINDALLQKKPGP
jgi:hypothetical protein